MNTLGEEVRKTIVQFGLLEGAKITVLKGAQGVLDQLKTGEKAAITA
jgi:Fe2+ transport system protein FeoA